MCQDPNAGKRQEAKIRDSNRRFAYGADSVKYWNRETTFKRKRNFIRGKGRSHELGNFQVAMNIAQGKSLFSKQQSAAKFFGGLKDTSDGSRTSGRKHKLQTLYAAYAANDYQMSQLRGFGQANFLTGLNRKQSHLENKNREQLGAKPNFGHPTMMPPRDTTGMFMNALSTGLSIAAAIPSDIKLKENIKEVGTSKEGYNIYEFNYKNNPTRRYRGAMAQDVVKKNPMAVGIKDGYLTVNYNKIDVRMEALQ